MPYITPEEFKELAIGELSNAEQFATLEARARISIDLYTRRVYQFTDLEKEPEDRKKAVKLAVAFQMLYLDTSGVMTADDRVNFASITVGRTSVSYKDKGDSASARFNLSQDALNALNAAGFSELVAACYDR